MEAGHWGAQIVFYRPVEKIRRDDSGGQNVEKYLLLRTYTVFNLDQVEGEEADRLRGTPAEPAAPANDRVQQLIEVTGAVIEHGGDRAFYCRPIPEEAFPDHSSGDYIRLPHPEQFDPKDAYYETLLHELAHWSEIRLGWKESYALNELVAEIASCYLASELGLSGESLGNHAAYVGSWLKELKNDASFIFKACSQASKVTDFLLGFQGSQASDGEVAAEEQGSNA